MEVNVTPYWPRQTLYFRYLCECSCAWRNYVDLLIHFMVRSMKHLVLVCHAFLPTVLYFWEVKSEVAVLFGIT